MVYIHNCLRFHGAIFELTENLSKKHVPKKVRVWSKKAPLGFEPRISCLLDRRFNQLSHGAVQRNLGLNVVHFHVKFLINFLEGKMTEKIAS